MLDFETAEKLVDPRIREVLFVTAVSNSCVNPFLYGNYMKECCQTGSTGTDTISSEIYRPTSSGTLRPVLIQIRNINNSSSSQRVIGPTQV